MYELMGSIIFALSCLLALSIPVVALVELYDEVVQAWRDRQRKRDGDDTESELHLGGSGFRLGLPRLRQRRRLEIRPRGTFGFGGLGSEARWTSDD